MSMTDVLRFEIHGLRREQVTAPLQSMRDEAASRARFLSGLLTLLIQAAR